jgi:hypothetical protein
LAGELDLQLSLTALGDGIVESEGGNLGGLVVCDLGGGATSVM